MRLARVLVFFVMVAVACAGDTADTSTTAVPVQGSGAAATTTTPAPVTTSQSSRSNRTPDAALVEATCQALRTERMAGREAAVTEFRRSVPGLAYLEQEEPLIAACGELLKQHMESRALALRSNDISFDGRSGGVGCRTDGAPVTNVFANVSASRADAVLIAKANASGRYIDFQWFYEPDISVGETRETTFEWGFSGVSGYGCSVRARGWTASDSTATATLHELGDPPDAELPPGSPPLDTASDDWRVVLNSLNAFSFWQSTNLDVDLVEETVDARSQLFAQVVESMEEDLRYGVATSYTGLSVESVTAVEEITDNIVAITYELGPGTFSDIFEGESEAPEAIAAQTRWGVLIKSAVDGRWRWLVGNTRVEGDF